MVAERVTRRQSRLAERATDREVGVVAAVLVAGSEKGSPTASVCAPGLARQLAQLDA